MVTALTFYGSDTDATLQTDSRQLLANLTEGSSTTASHYWLAGGGEGAGYIAFYWPGSSGTTYHVSSSLPGTLAASALVYEGTLLEGKIIPSGTWSFTTTHHCANGDTTINVDLVYRVWRRASDGTKTLLGSLTNSNQTITGSNAAITTTGTLPDMSFGTGERLVVDMFLYERGSGFTLTTRIFTYYFTTDPAVGNTGFRIVTPGFYTPTTWYVSAAVGTSGNGTSWSTAWKDFSNIVWASIQPGDTIEVDGGTNGLTYGPLLITASGTVNNPITIRASTATGHSGQVIQSGGRTGTGLPYSGCPSASWTETATITYPLLRFRTYTSVIIDGSRWHGWRIHGNASDGVDMGTTGGGQNTIRYLEIDDCGAALVDGATNTYYTNNSGVHPMNTDFTIEYCDIHDNGQDCMQTGTVADNFIVRKSWLHFNREHPDYPGLAFNAARPDTGVGTHQDGYQTYNAISNTGVTFEDCLFGPGLAQGLILVMNTSNVTIRQCLF